MKMNSRSLKVRGWSTVLTVLAGLLLVFSADSALAGKSKRKAKMSFEQCCDENAGDTKKCLKMKGVKGKRDRKTKKAKVCQSSSAVESADNEEDL